MRQGLYGAVPMTHFFLTPVVHPGDTVVDATCGNGGDAVFLARLVGDAGHVHAFDVQESALREAERRLRDEDLLDRVTLVHAGHERMSEHLQAGIGAVVFNLGFLPGGGRTIATAGESTVAALETAAGLLRPGGMVAIAVYTGHPGGEAEAAMVRRWGEDLSPSLFNVWQSRQLNRSSVAPYVIVVEKGAS